MARPRQANPESAEEEGPVPIWQILLDDYFLLLALGLVVPFIIYIAWGLWDLAHLTPAP